MPHDNRPNLAAPAIHPDHILDGRGAGAGWLILKAAGAMDTMENGHTLEVVGDDPRLLSDLPPVAEHHGCHLLRVSPGSDQCRFLLRKQGPSNGGSFSRSAPGVIPNPDQRRTAMSDLLSSAPETSSTVDARGSACPGPLLEAKKAIGSVKVGQVLEVLSGDPGTKDDIPLWAGKVGHEYLGHQEADGYSRLFVRRKK